MIAGKDTTIAQHVAAWDRGDSVQSIEMGGIGPGYEQAIQILIIELLRDNDGKELPKPGNTEGWGDDTVRRIDEQCLGFSGAQVGAAKNVAYRMLADGVFNVIESMRLTDADRLLFVSKSWPRAEAVQS
jgi:hypothetical protein